MRQKAGALEFKTETFAQTGAGQAIDGTGRIFTIQDENIGEETLEGARVDLALHRNGAAFAQPAPIAHQQMRILVLHGNP